MSGALVLCWLSAEAPSFSTRWPLSPSVFLSSRTSFSRRIGWTSLQNGGKSPRESIPSRQAPIIASCLLISHWWRQVTLPSPKSMYRELHKDVTTEMDGSLPPV